MGRAWRSAERLAEIKEAPADFRRNSALLIGAGVRAGGFGLRLADIDGWRHGLAHTFVAPPDHRDVGPNPIAVDGMAETLLERAEDLAGGDDRDSGLK